MRFRCPGCGEVVDEDELDGEGASLPAYWGSRCIDIAPLDPRDELGGEA